MSDLVGYPEDRFCHDVLHMLGVFVNKLYPGLETHIFANCNFSKFLDTFFLVSFVIQAMENITNCQQWGGVIAEICWIESQSPRYSPEVGAPVTYNRLP